MNLLQIAPHSTKHVHAKYVRRELEKLAHPRKAEASRRFFKIEEGQYGAGDFFVGVTVPESRKVAKQFKGLPLQQIKELLDSKVHEERQVALLILLDNYNHAPVAEKENILRFYLSNSSRINNWDLVDLTAPNILGAHLINRERDLLYRFAKSDNIWEKRMAIVATLYFIRKNDFADTLKIAEMLMHDNHDLIHKAVGWMLREVGKRNISIEEAFIARHNRAMPRTMLRYAIEKFPEIKKRKYMQR